MTASPDASQGRLIAVDWGTSRLRARLVDERGAVVATADSDKGIGALSAGQHEAAFEAAVAGWPEVAAILSGMIGSRQGWREAAYVPCPATAAAIATAVTRLTTTRGRPVAIIPGLKATAGEGDVLRGEETQIVGALDGEPGFAGLAILPGTHSKWAKIEKGAVAGFHTFMSGELFDLLARTSFLRHSVADPHAAGDVSGSADFGLAVERTAKEGVPFLATLFSVRVRQLLADAKPADNLAYLSGLIIGGEIAAAAALGALGRTTPIRIIAASGLSRAYHRAF